MTDIPQEVLGEALSRALRGRHVRAAVFTTFTFDPGFFELQVLPYLFDRPDRTFHRVDKARRAQLEEALRPVDQLAVYYDRAALDQDATPAQTDFRRIDVRRKTGGFFHPKVILALVDEPDPDPPAIAYQSLVVGVLSANLTRAGWWENVETAHFEELRDEALDSSRVPFRRDLLSLIRRIRESAAPDEDQRALDLIHEFVRRRTATDTYDSNKAKHRYLTRLFTGQSDFPAWLEEVGLGNGGWNLEIVSPYFDRAHGETIRRLIEAVGAKETRVFLPREADGSAAVTRECFEALDGLVRWADLPTAVRTPSGRAHTKGAMPRRVHAKVYRLWRQGEQDVAIVGSVNATAAAHSHGAAGNLEAAFLVDCTDRLRQRWWLEPLDKPPRTFSSRVAEASAVTDESFADVSFRFRWDTVELHARSESGTSEPLAVAQPGGVVLFQLPKMTWGKWVPLGRDAAERVQELLRSTSYLEVRGPKGAWRVLVREEGMVYRPSVVTTWTPEEILMYWSLLSPAQRERFMIERLTAGASEEGLDQSVKQRFEAGNTVFDRFAGVYHAFERFHQHIREALAAGRTREAEELLFGEKFDSLPVLLRGVLERDDGDPVVAYVTLLSARQLRERIAAAHSQFLRDHREAVARLDALIDRYPAVRDRIGLDGDDVDRFFEWYEQQFLRLIEQPAGVE